MKYESKYKIFPFFIKMPLKNVVCMQNVVCEAYRCVYVTGDIQDPVLRKSSVSFLACILTGHWTTVYFTETKVVVSRHIFALVVVSVCLAHDIVFFSRDYDTTMFALHTNNFNPEL